MSNSANHKIIKYLNPKKYLNFVQRKYYFSKYDSQKEEADIIQSFQLANLDYEKAKNTLSKMGLLEEIYKGTTMASNHWLIFAALSKAHKINSILEIGTFNGETAKLLHRLFPQARITTVDLKDDDPIFTSFYGRSSSEELQNFIQKRSDNLSSIENLTFIQDSSFFLPSKVEEKFDLVWVDGAHNFPEVSWDICNGYNLTKEDGYLMCDDVIQSSEGYKDDYVSSESYEVINHFLARSHSLCHWFLKRNLPEYSAIPKKKKYVALIQKKT